MAYIQYDALQAWPIFNTMRCKRRPYRQFDACMDTTSS